MSLISFRGLSVLLHYYAPIFKYSKRFRFAPSFNNTDTHHEKNQRHCFYFLFLLQTGLIGMPKHGNYFFFCFSHYIKSFHAFFRIRQTFIKVEKVYRVIKVNMAQTIKHHVEKNCSTTTEFFSSFFNLLSFTQESSSKGVILNELRFCDFKRDCLRRQCRQSLNDSK